MNRDQGYHIPAIYNQIILDDMAPQSLENSTESSIHVLSDKFQAAGQDEFVLVVE